MSDRQTECDHAWVMLLMVQLVFYLLRSNSLCVCRYRSGPHRASLFSHVVNVSCGEAHDRQMTSGKHTIRNIFCVSCATELGWTYVAAEHEENRYKVGKFILIDPLVRKHERTHVRSRPTSDTDAQTTRSQTQETAATPVHTASRSRSESGASASASAAPAAATSSASSSRRSSFGHAHIISARVTRPSSASAARVVVDGGASSSDSSSSSDPGLGEEAEFELARQLGAGARLLRRVLAEESALARALGTRIALGRALTTGASVSMEDSPTTASSTVSNASTIVVESRSLLHPMFASPPPTPGPPNPSPVAPDLPPASTTSSRVEQANAGQRRIS